MFIPETQARLMAIDLSRDDVTPDPARVAVAEEVVDLYRGVFPWVSIELDLANGKANSKAFPDLPPRIVLWGGLAYHQHVFREGLLLALAHEVGHFDKQDATIRTQPCEGLADYVGARYVMRQVCGCDYAEILGRALDQFAAFLGNPIGRSNESTLCETHPDGVCRIDTFRAAMDEEPMPACAQPPFRFV